MSDADVSAPEARSLHSAYFVFSHAPEGLPIGNSGLRMELWTSRDVMREMLRGGGILVSRGEACLLLMDEEETLNHLPCQLDEESGVRG